MFLFSFSFCSNAKSPKCINLPTYLPTYQDKVCTMKRKAPTSASAANDVVKKVKGAHIPSDDNNGQQVRPFLVFTSSYLFKSHYTIFSFYNRKTKIFTKGKFRRADLQADLFTNLCVSHIHVLNMYLYRDILRVPSKYPSSITPYH